MIAVIYMNVVKGNYIKENDMAVTTMIDLQKLKAICLEKVIEHFKQAIINGFIRVELKTWSQDSWKENNND